MPYVDAFVVAVPKDKIDAYKAVESSAAEVWKKHGALSVVACLADDVPYGELTSYPRAVQAKEDEIVAISWITYESRESRDAVNAAVMNDPWMADHDSASMPFDGKRMIFGGFTPFLGL